MEIAAFSTARTAKPKDEDSGNYICRGSSVEKAMTAASNTARTEAPNTAEREASKASKIK
jgi:hypothetical protein